MAINFQQVYTRIREIGSGARERTQALEQRRATAQHLLEAYAGQLDSLRDKVDQAKAVDPNLRCARPVSEGLTTHHPSSTALRDATLIAADGSQINPDRHAAVNFCLVNIGVILMRLNSGQPPEVNVTSELMFGDELETRTGPLTEGMVALQRDLKERSRLEELSKDLPGAVITFTDGPIELWGAKGEQAEAYLESFNAYLTVLARLQARGIVTAGYVDKPSADLVVGLLEIAAAAPEDLKRLREYHPLRGVSDRWLYRLLPSSQRSAVFGLQSSSEKNYTGLLSLHFFYLNVGSDEHPWPVRVEIPKWVADDPQKLDLLQAVLVDQCRMMGSKPYPYLLHRAHETALATLEEKQQIEQMLAQELRSQNAEVDEISNKQFHKDLPGRTRM